MTFNAQSERLNTKLKAQDKKFEQLGTQTAAQTGALNNLSTKLDGAEEAKLAAEKAKEKVYQLSGALTPLRNEITSLCNRLELLDERDAKFETAKAKEKEKLAAAG
eukprot:2157120-Ditylum_brightwellii.AAC.1